jgi:hypothetical protein
VPCCSSVAQGADMRSSSLLIIGGGTAVGWALCQSSISRSIRGFKVALNL